jgi:hypothetical protein
MRPGPSEKSHNRPRAAKLVTIVKVIAAGVVKVYREFHQAQPHNAAVEIDVLLRVSRYRRDVMQAGNGSFTGVHGVP